jgi:RNA-binding protein NOB1
MFLLFVSVSDFARKTGDYRSLSATDVRVLALTYMLEKEFVGESHIKGVPERKVRK